MDWERATADQIDEAFDHFLGLAGAALARVCDLIAEVDRRQAWMTDGAANLTDWVSAKLRVRHSTARQLVSVARRLIDLPMVRKRLASGELSLDQADAISRMATPETERGLIEEAMGLTNAALDRRARTDLGVSMEKAKSVWERRKLVRQWNLDESELRFNGRLPGAEARMFDQAIDDRLADVPPNPETGLFDPLPTRAADALTELAATSGDNDRSSDVMVFADFDALLTEDDGGAALDNTAPIPNETAQRLGCDAAVRAVIAEGRQVIGIGRKRRKIPGWLRRLVYARDGGMCQLPGCRNTRWLQNHHIQSWAHGGPTDLDNLILLCGFHHRHVHEHGWHITGPPEAR
ncbi:MAG TPA: DUF222 domain-containing protein, partial [Acidimicrobiia bacterium]